MIYFEGMWHWTRKMNITFFGEIGYRIQFSSFFLKTPHTVRLKPEKLVLRGTFSPIFVVPFGRLFRKTIAFTHKWTRTNHVNFMKIGSKLRRVSCVLIHTCSGAPKGGLEGLQPPQTQPPLKILNVTPQVTNIYIQLMLSTKSAQRLNVK